MSENDVIVYVKKKQFFLLIGDERAFKRGDSDSGQQRGKQLYKFGERFDVAM